MTMVAQPSLTAAFLVREGVIGRELPTPEWQSPTRSALRWKGRESRTSSLGMSPKRQKTRHPFRSRGRKCRTPPPAQPTTRGGWNPHAQIGWRQTGAGAFKRRGATSGARAPHTENIITSHHHLKGQVGCAQSGKIHPAQTELHRRGCFVSLPLNISRCTVRCIHLHQDAVISVQRVMLHYLRTCASPSNPPSAPPKN